MLKPQMAGKKPRVFMLKTVAPLGKNQPNNILSPPNPRGFFYLPNSSRFSF
jgi:hypothetical protein